MVWGSGKGGMMEDLEKGIAWVKEYERGQRGEFWDEELVVVGHSAGGGLVQGSLGRGTMRIGGLVLVAAIPFTGGYVSFLFFLLYG
jgi:alpha-beta hydrolase superfamily lysophospholipase